MPGRHALSTSGGLSWCEAWGVQGGLILAGFTVFAGAGQHGGRPYVCKLLSCFAL